MEIRDLILICVQTYPQSDCVMEQAVRVLLESDPLAMHENIQKVMKIRNDILVKLEN